MGGMRRRDDEGSEGRPVEPTEAREHGNDPGAVRIHRRDNAGGAGERTPTGRRDDDKREETGERRGDRGGGRSMERSDKVLISALAVLGVVLFVVIAALSLLETPEWIQFVLALVLFAALGLGAYRYVITPSGRGQESESN